MQCKRLVLFMVYYYYFSSDLIIELRSVEFHLYQVNCKRLRKSITSSLHISRTWNRQAETFSRAKIDPRVTHEQGSFLLLLLYSTIPIPMFQFIFIIILDCTTILPGNPITTSPTSIAIYLKGRAGQLLELCSTPYIGTNCVPKNNFNYFALALPSLRVNFNSPGAHHPQAMHRPQYVL